MKPTNNFRWFCEIEFCYSLASDGKKSPNCIRRWLDDTPCHSVPILQQGFVDESGNIEWRCLDCVFEDIKDAEKRLEESNKDFKND